MTVVPLPTGAASQSRSTLYHLLQRGTALVRPGSFEQVLLTTVDPSGQARLSDHCPIALLFETDGEIETSDAITVLLDRLDAVQAELQEIRGAVAALRE